MPAPTRPVYTFESTGAAYDGSQTRDEIKDGDVLAIPSEGVYGFLYLAWPVAVTEVTGHLHGADLDGLRREGYGDSIDAAIAASKV